MPIEIIARRKINLLTGAHLQQARKSMAIEKIAVALAAIFLFCVLFVAVMLLTINMTQAAVVSSTAALAAVDFTEAERVARLAAETRARGENAARFFTEENIDIVFLGTIAAAGHGLAIEIYELEMDNRERSIYVSGRAEDVTPFVSFVGNLEAGDSFREINVAELESKDGFTAFFLELKPAIWLEFSDAR